jgi:E3 ubiquitin-protein ligase UHRF1
MNNHLHSARPWVAGIAPGPKGAYSIALSGGYDDDVDMGLGL